MNKVDKAIKPYKSDGRYVCYSRADNELIQELIELAPYSAVLRNQLIDALENKENIREPYKTKILAWNVIKQALQDKDKLIEEYKAEQNIFAIANRKLKSKLDKIEKLLCAIDEWNVITQLEEIAKIFDNQ